MYCKSKSRTKNDFPIIVIVHSIGSRCNFWSLIFVV